MAKKSDHIVTITSTITKTEKYLICGEDKEMAKYQDCIAKISTLNLFSNGKWWLSPHSHQSLNVNMF